MIDREVFREIVLNKMKELGLKIDTEGAKVSVVADLIAEVIPYILQNNVVQVDTNTGIGKFS